MMTCTENATFSGQTRWNGMHLVFSQNDNAACSIMEMPTGVDLGVTKNTMISIPVYKYTPFARHQDAQLNRNTRQERSAAENRSDN